MSLNNNKYLNAIEIHDKILRSRLPYSKRKLPEIEQGNESDDSDGNEQINSNSSRMSSRMLNIQRPRTCNSSIAVRKRRYYAKEIKEVSKKYF